jgi:hypothetical protein
MQQAQLQNEAEEDSGMSKEAALEVLHAAYPGLATVANEGGSGVGEGGEEEGSKKRRRGGAKVQPQHNTSHDNTTYLFLSSAVTPIQPPIRLSGYCEAT